MKLLVVDKEVLRLYFEQRRAADLERFCALSNSTNG